MIPTPFGPAPMWGPEAVSGSLPRECLVDVDGKSWDLRELTDTYVTIVCTIKCFGCPICPEQVRRLLAAPLKSCFIESKVHFVMICPGSDEEVRAIRDEVKE